MRKSYWLIILLLLGIGIRVTDGAQTKSAAQKEHEIKAAFIYNFLKFIDWPEDTADKEKTVAESDKKNGTVITLGIIGEKEYFSAFKVSQGKKVKDKKIQVVYLSEKDINAKYPKSLKNCTVLFFHAQHDKKRGKDESYQYDLKKILALIKGKSVLTIGETKGFLEQGGMINFVVAEKKIRFEINLVALEQAKLKARAQLLKLAKRVVQKKKKSPAQNRDN